MKWWGGRHGVQSNSARWWEGDQETRAGDSSSTERMDLVGDGDSETRDGVPEAPEERRVLKDTKSVSFF